MQIRGRQRIADLVQFWLIEGLTQQQCSKECSSKPKLQIFNKNPSLKIPPLSNYRWMIRHYFVNLTRGRRLSVEQLAYLKFHKMATFWEQILITVSYQASCLQYAQKSHMISCANFPKKTWFCKLVSITKLFTQTYQYYAACRYIHLSNSLMWHMLSYTKVKYTSICL